MTNLAPNNSQLGDCREYLPNVFKARLRFLAFASFTISCLCLGNIVQAVGLSLNQQADMASLAANVPWPSGRSLATDHPLGSQTLSIEKQERKNQHGIRWVSVYQYNYTLRTARLLVMDVQQNSAIKQSSIDSVHLPLNETEIHYAISLLAKDDELMEALRNEHSQRAALPFTSIEELDIKASIYEPRETEHACQHERCALLSLFDQSSTVFTVEPVVNLTTLSVSILDPQ